MAACISVEWTPLRGTEPNILSEGLHVVSPLARVYRVDLRQQEAEDSLDVLANNGLDIKLTSSILYRPIASEVYQLITQTGADYYAVLIAPYVRSSARKIVGDIRPKKSIHPSASRSNGKSVRKSRRSSPASTYRWMPF